MNILDNSRISCALLTSKHNAQPLIIYIYDDGKQTLFRGVRPFYPTEMSYILKAILKLSYTYIPSDKWNGSVTFMLTDEDFFYLQCRLVENELIIEIPGNLISNCNKDSILLHLHII
jgi:hypothetical protein